MTDLQTSLTDGLTADECGHQPSAGKAITISLTYQEMVMYDNGCEVNATPVTTGRPSAPTNVGNWEVFQKLSPCLMHSPWPPGSALWYPDTVVQWAMQFQSGGYFIHDAYWEALSSYGPGSEYETWNDTASRGCVQTPTAIMGWLYNWTPLGTPVIITA
jgi:lipoprotein-anchoring transpeptidase ErfK/SrfK